MSATGAGAPRRGRPAGTDRVRWTAALRPVLGGALVAAVAVGLATTAHAAVLGLGSPALGAGAAPVTRCAPSSGLAVTPVVASEPLPAVVAYSVTAVRVTGLTGCAGGTVSVTVRTTSDAALQQVTAAVPAGVDSVQIPLQPALDPTRWLGWSASVSPA